MRNLKEERVLETNKMNCGEICTIIEYFNANNITVQFEDGKIIKNIQYCRFKKGEIKKIPNKELLDIRVGETRMMSCGMNATIIKYNKNSDINIEFEDGYVSEHKSYKEFLKGKIHNKNINYKNFIDLTGQKFNRWTVLYKDNKRIKTNHEENKRKGSSSSTTYWICRCECGNERSVGSSNLKYGTSKSCGCLERELTIQRNIKLKSFLENLENSRPEIYELLENKEDGKITIGSSRKATLKCPICNQTRVYSVDYLAKSGFSCLNCSSKNSYPNRLVYKFLNQLGIEFESEKSFDWVNRKRYDFYIPKYNMIIEAHGLQHYADCTWSKATEQKENDKYKEYMARLNGIENYIQLDCRFSNLKYIKESIENSKISEILNIEKIDWDKINKELSKNIEYKGGTE